MFFDTPVSLKLQKNKKQPLNIQFYNLENGMFATSLKRNKTLNPC